MDVSRQEAQESLQVIHEVAAQMRRNVARGGGPYYMVLWGAIWFLGFLMSHFVHDIYQGWVWLTLVFIGTVASAYLGYRFRSKVRSQIDVRFTHLWFAIIAYSSIWMWLAQPKTGEQASVLITSFMMFAYVVIGLWIERTAAWVGLIVTAFALLSYVLIRDYYFLCMAFLGGGTLMFSGFYILRKWK
ncbi:MAG TPA: hypothetical protein G4O11_01820 [Anaerolineae bacterium]|nr:hypothetical protein [Anaerolineae bacterium]